MTDMTAQMMQEFGQWFLNWYDSIEKNNANKIQLLSKLNIIWNMNF